MVSIQMKGAEASNGQPVKKQKGGVDEAFKLGRITAALELQKTKVDEETKAAQLQTILALKTKQDSLDTMMQINQMLAQGMFQRAMQGQPPLPGAEMMGGPPPLPGAPPPGMGGMPPLPMGMPDMGGMPPPDMGGGMPPDMAGGMPPGMEGMMAGGGMGGPPPDMGGGQPPLPPIMGG
jgi:hypothetical protein